MPQVLSEDSSQKSFEVYQRAERFARLANRDIASVLADTIQLSIPPIRADILDLEPISDLADEQVLALTELQMEPDQDARLSELLIANRQIS